jgi:hypothetical protein
MIENRLEEIASGSEAGRPPPSLLYAIQEQDPLQGLANQINILQQQVLSLVGPFSSSGPFSSPGAFPYSRKRKVEPVLTSRQQEMAALAEEKQRKEEEAKARMAASAKKPRIPRSVTTDVLSVSEEHPEDIAYREMISKMKEMKLENPTYLRDADINKLPIYQTMNRW